MAQAEVRETLSVEKEKLFNVVTHYEDYPQFVEGCQSVKVERKAPGHARVSYHVSMMKDITYTLDLVEDREAGTVKWTLVESDFMKKNEGGWEMKSAAPGKTDVRYWVDIEFNFPVPGFILSRLVKGNLPSMVRGFEKRVRNV